MMARVPSAFRAAPESGPAYGNSEPSGVRSFMEEALQAPKRLVTVELVRRLLKSLQPPQRIGRLRRVAGHLLISPRWILRSTVSVKELIDTYFAKNRSSTEPSKNTL